MDGLQSALGRADRLNLYAYHTGDPAYVAQDLARYRRLSPDRVAEAARRYLVEAPAATLSVVPRGRRDLAADGGS